MKEFTSLKIDFLTNIEFPDTESYLLLKTVKKAEETDSTSLKVDYKSKSKSYTLPLTKRRKYLIIEYIHKESDIDDEEERQQRKIVNILLTPNFKSHLYTEVNKTIKELIHLTLFQIIEKSKEKNIEGWKNYDLVLPIIQKGISKRANFLPK